MIQKVSCCLQEQLTRRIQELQAETSKTKARIQSLKKRKADLSVSKNLKLPALKNYLIHFWPPSPRTANRAMIYNKSLITCPLNHAPYWRGPQRSWSSRFESTLRTCGAFWSRMNRWSWTPWSWTWGIQGPSWTRFLRSGITTTTRSPRAWAAYRERWVKAPQRRKASRSDLHTAQ